MAVSPAKVICRQVDFRDCISWEAALVSGTGVLLEPLCGVNAHYQYLRKERQTVGKAWQAGKTEPRSGQAGCVAPVLRSH